MFIVDRSAEARLVETLGDLRDQCDSWTAVAFHLSELMDEYKSDYQLKIALNMANDLLRAFEGAIYAFDDGSLLVLCNHLSHVLLNKLVFQLRYLYMDDPLAYTPDGIENPDFCAVYRLHQDWQACNDLATRAMMRAARKDRAAPQIAQGPAGRFSASRLADIERDMGKMDLSAALRRQPVCASGTNGAMRRVFDELYIHMPHLRELLKVNVDFLSNKWLFKYITRLLDDRVLAMLKADAQAQLAYPLSININAESLLTDAFAAFDAALSPALKVAIVFEIPVVDAFADMAAFTVARETVQRQGYRVCLDGLSTQSFVHIDRERLGADLVKLQWNADVTADLNTPENKRLGGAIRESGSSRVILCRCDTKAAVDYGQSMGVALFQGRYIDGLLNPGGVRN